MSRFTRYSRISPRALHEAQLRLAWRCFGALLPLFLALLAGLPFWRVACRFGDEGTGAPTFVGVPVPPSERAAEARPAVPAPTVPPPAVEPALPELAALPLLPPEAVAELPPVNSDAAPAAAPLVLSLPAELTPARPAVAAARPVAPKRPPEQGEAGAFTPASYRSTPQPPYPPALRSSRLAGEVALRIELDAEGVPLRVDVCRSSGQAAFDRCAREWVLAHWRFYPARRGELAVPSVVRSTVAFVLR